VKQGETRNGHAVRTTLRISQASAKRNEAQPGNVRNEERKTCSQRPSHQKHERRESRKIANMTEEKHESDLRGRKHQSEEEREKSFK